MELVLVSLGAAVLWFMGHRFGAWMASKIPWRKAEDAPAGIDKDQWLAAVSEAGPGAPYIGSLERMFVYLVVLFAREEAGLLVGGWLAFKVASKWEMWTNVVQMPSSFGNSTDAAAQLSSLRARRKLGYVMYDRFLIGTLGNVMLGGMAAGLVIRFADPILDWASVVRACVTRTPPL